MKKENHMNGEQIHSARLSRQEKKFLSGRMGNFLMFLPNMVLLLGRLLKDPRVANAEKALFAAAIVYVISPLDLIPDFFPFIGQVDDIYMVSLTLLRLLNRTDADVVRQHWQGGGDIVALADTIANIAPKFLPRRISRVLSSRVEMGSAARILKGIKNNHERLVVEIPGAGDAAEDREIDAQSAMTN